MCRLKRFSMWKGNMKIIRPITKAVASTGVMLAAAAGAQAQEIYAGFGFPVVQIGYAHSINDKLGVRGEFGTSGSLSRDGVEEGISYKGKLKTDRLGLFGDYFPASNGFRLTGGLTFNSMSLALDSNYTTATAVNIGDNPYNLGPGSFFNVAVKFPSTMPYVGIGWGHNKREKGWGFVADFGVAIGTPKVSYSTNVNISQADIDKELQQVKDGVAKITVLPQVTLGLSYRF